MWKGNRKEACGCLEDRGQAGGLRAGSGWWKEDQRLAGSPTKVPLNGRTSLPLQMLAVTSSRFQPPSPPPQDRLPICFDSPSCNQ